MKETNPTRAEIEKALGPKMPSLMETIQHLRAENIRDITLQPGVRAFEGRTIPAAAGFLPPVEEREPSFVERTLFPKPTMPAVAPGMVRLYSGQEGGSGASGVWWTSNIERAASFGKNLSWVDLPEAEARAFQKTSQDFTLPDEWVRLAEPYTGPEVTRQVAGAKLEGTTFVLDEVQFAPRVNSKPPDSVPDFRPEEITGARVNLPRTTYHEAAQSEGNPWVRRSQDPARSADTDNSDRTLLVQISSSLINPESLAGAKDEATRYYDLLYSGARPGYARMQDFWEIPQWMGYASKFIPNADVYVVRDIAKAKEFLAEAGYGRIAFSALDTNKGMIRELAKDYPGQVDVGGYVDPKTFADLPNVKWHDSLESLAKDMGLPYEEGVDYRHFQGSDVIPRLTMSKGCRHKCAFCSVPKVVETTPEEVVNQQADAIAQLGTKLVYLNDKTFGQAANYKQLIEVNRRIKAANPEFKGFIIQTTAAQLKSLTPEFLKESGIKFVELGIESYNDPILRAMHKPATESIINQVTDKLRQAGVALIPNIIIGFPQETAETYAKTIQWLKDNRDIISHANIYNLALYKDAELGKQVISISDNDFNENVLEKSFHTNPEIHRQFAGEAYGLASEMLGTKPPAAQFAPAKIETIPGRKEDLFPVGPVFYSQLNRVVDQKFSGEEMPSNQLLGILRNPQNGVKQEELAWSGIEEYLKERPRVTRGEIQSFLKDNQVELQEVTKGGEPDIADVEAWWTDEGGANEATTFSDLSPRGQQEAIARYRDEVGPFEGEKTKFESYQLPGGENYREVLLTLPETVPTFTSGHWEEPNVVVHARINDRTDSSGEPGLFAEEIQSDWHQQGRKVGYGKPKPITELPADYILRPSRKREGKSILSAANLSEYQRIVDEVNKKVADPSFWDKPEQKPLIDLDLQVSEAIYNHVLPDKAVFDVWLSKAREYVPDAFSRRDPYASAEIRLGYGVFGPGGRRIVWHENQSGALERALEYLNRKQEEAERTVPEAPFKKTWHELMFRRLVRLAAEQGKSWLGWTTGEQQAERYDLSKQLSRVKISQTAVGHYGIDAYNPAGTLVVSQSYPEAKLPEVIGKELADRAIADLAKREPLDKTVSYSGLDLKVGGEGMRGFYDKILVDYANKFGKKFGARVENRSVDYIRPKEGEYAQATAGERTGAATIHSLPITDAMRKSVVSEGVAQFAPPKEVREPAERREDLFRAPPLSAERREAQFTPANEPRAIRRAAIRSRNERFLGRVFTGEYHQVAEVNAGRAGHPLPSNFEYGWETNEGEFLTRQQAARRAEEMGQMTPGRVYPQEGLHSGDMDLTQFLPSKNPRAIKEAAIKDEETGRVFTGQFHSDAGWAAHRAGVKSDRWIEGFVTNSNQFLNRDEAYKRAVELKQISEPAYEPDEVLAEPKLEAMKFEEARQFLPAETVVIRHGSTSMNADNPTEDRIRGFKDVPLSADGKKEVAKLAEKLKDSGIQTVVTSDLQRAVETAEAVAEATGAKVEEEPGLRPWHFGPTIEGQQTKKMLPVIEQLVRHPDQVPEGGESFNSFKDRFLSAYERVQEEHLGEKIAIVTHYRGTKLLDAWRGGREVDVDKFVEFDDTLKPATFETRAPEAQFTPSKQERENNRAYLRDAQGTHGWWLNPVGQLLRLKTGEHATDAIQILGLKVDKKDRYDAYSEAAIGAYKTLVSKGWLAVLPQTYYKGGQPVSTLLIRGMNESYGKQSVIKLNRSQREAMERLAIEHELTLLNNLGDPIYKPPSVPAGGEEPSQLGGVQFAPGQKKREKHALFLGHVIAGDSVDAVNISQDESASHYDYRMLGGARWRYDSGDKSVTWTNEPTSDEKYAVENWLAKRGFSVQDHFEGTEAQFAPAKEEQPELIDLPEDRTKPLTNRQVARMTREQLLDWYPEAIVPRKRDEEIPSAILQSPLYKQAGSEAEAVQKFKDALVEFAKEYQDRPEYQSGLKWYSEFVPLLKEHYGEDAPLMAELLAGTSPQQRPETNFDMAEEALHRFKAGKYDRQIEKFEEGLDMIKDGSWKEWIDREVADGLVKNVPAKVTEDTFINRWYQKFDLAPRKENGKLYGISSKAVIRILARQWLQNTPGLKTQNFVQNLLGLGHEATIDLWADRTMRRLGYSKDQERWRVLPLNASPVTDPDFRFAQKAFRAAAEEMGVLPDALQGALWFAEKQLWADQGWSQLSLGDYRTEIKKRGEKSVAPPEQETLQLEPRPLR